MNLPLGGRVAYGKHFHSTEWKYHRPHFHVNSFVLKVNMSMKNGQFFFQNVSKTNRKIQKKNSYNLGMFKQFVKCKKAVALVEI